MTSQHRAATAVPLHPPLADRWSPRAFDDGHEIDDVTLTALLEAARWAPSASNTQPWRFLPARRGTAEHAALASLLAPGNRIWAVHASALILAAATTTDAAGKPLPWALYDTGQAVASLAVQAQADGLHVHQMGGFDADAAGHLLDLPAAVTPVVVLAVGRHDPAAALPESLVARENAPRTRLALGQLLLALDEASRSAA